MLSSRLHFVPTLVDDTNQIMNTQRARGVILVKSIKKDPFLYLILLPLFASSFKRADAYNCDGSERVQRPGEDEHAIGLCSGE